MFHNKYRPAPNNIISNGRSTKGATTKWTMPTSLPPGPPRPRETWQTIHLRDQHSQQNTTPSPHQPLRPHPIWPSTPLSPDRLPRQTPGQPCPQKRVTTHPAPIDVITTASVTWKQSKSHNFFSETPTLHLCQESTRSPASVR